MFFFYKLKNRKKVSTSIIIWEGATFTTSIEQNVINFEYFFIDVINFEYFLLLTFFSWLSLLEKCVWKNKYETLNFICIEIEMLFKMRLWVKMYIYLKRGVRVSKVYCNWRFREERRWRKGWALDHSWFPFILFYFIIFLQIFSFCQRISWTGLWWLFCKNC